MRAVAVKELKSRLSAYLREVAKGEVVLVTDRGRVIAELRRPTTELTFGAVEQALERLHAEGVSVPGSHKRLRRTAEREYSLKAQSVSLYL
jgi:prevent-host-death family protein